MAEGLFQHVVDEAGLQDKFDVDSCGTGGWHVGELPDPRMRETAKKHGLNLTMKARQWRDEDLEEFDFILAMDKSNLRNLSASDPKLAESHEGLFLMRHFDDVDGTPDVPDPYYGGDQGFEDVYQMLLTSCQNLLNHIREQRGF